MKFNITELNLIKRSMTRWQIEAESYEEAEAITIVRVKPQEITITIENDEVTQKRRRRDHLEEVLERRRKIDEDDKEWRKTEEERILRNKNKEKHRNLVIRNTE